MDALAAILDALPTWLLFLLACTGHTFFMVVSLNVLYGWPLPHALLRVTRKIDILVILAGPVLFCYALGFFDGGGLSWEPGHRGYLVTPYTVFCVVLGCTVAPAAIILYHLRRTPPHLIEARGTIVDVARELGYPPMGTGRQRRLTRLPFNQCFHVEFAERTFALPRLPKAWDGLTILHVTDLHLCGTPDRAFYQYVMDRCMKWGVPDIVAITGDIVDSNWHHRWIVPVLGRLKWKVAAYGILGNHDSWRDTVLIRRRMRRVGVRVLDNRWEQLDVRGEPMIVIGHEGPWFTPAPDLSSCPDGPFRFCLSHTPDNIKWARQNRIDLVLAGHVHGGQIRLPPIGSLFVPSRYSRHYDAGTFFEEPTLMYVSRGLAGQHPLRFFCRPEVTWLTLRAG
jgi:uncharacterized protein